MSGNASSTGEKEAKTVSSGDELKAPKDVVGDRHDDGLWPDFDLATESVRTEGALATGYAKGPKPKRSKDTKVVSGA